MVDKASFGEKHRCPYCGIRFYDMNKHPVVCPKCGKSLEEEPEEPSEVLDDALDDETTALAVAGDDVLDVEGVEEIITETTPIEPQIASDEMDWSDDG